MKNIIIPLAIVLITLINACKPMDKADLIITGAVIYTVDSNFTTAEAMAIAHGKILAVGTNDEITGKYTADLVYNLDGKAVYPGLIDAHCHFLGYGMGRLNRADLTGTRSMEEVVERVQQQHQKNPSLYWIEGRGWDQNDWTDKQFPDRAKLDELFPDNPLMLTRIDGHAALVNGKAMELAGIDAKTKIEGGEIILKNGQPTGILIDNAMELVGKVIPEATADEIIRALLLAQDDCFAVGLTSVHDAGLETQQVQIIDSLQRAGKLKMRINAMLSPTQENLDTYVDGGPYITDHLSVRSIKLYADGALGSRGALLIDDYSDDPGNRGIMLTRPDTIRSICQQAIDDGYQICTHAIGDSGNRMMLNLYGEFLQGSNDLRWRIEHAQIVAPEDFDLFGKYSIVPSVQPTHATSDMYWAVDRVGQERIKGAYAYQHLLEQSGWIPLGTDFPIEQINPMLTFFAATARQDAEGYPEGGFQAENALTREETLRGMTIWAARAAFEENKKGSLEPGKVADFVVLDADIMKIPLPEVPKVKVMKTFIGGQEVYSR
jgi:predicted amidohydrolase YtcJ